MVEVSTALLMVIPMLVDFIKEWDMVKDVTDGKIKVVMKVNGLKIKCMAMEPL